MRLEPYPYDRLGGLRQVADRHPGGCVDLSVGNPGDPAPPVALAALAGSGAEHSYPASIGTPALRGAAADWLARRFGVTTDPGGIAACVGTKEFVTSLPRLLALRAGESSPDGSRDTVLYPAVSYPSYAVGAQLSGLRAVPVRLDGRWRLDLAGVAEADAARALCLWVNSPANPTGALDDLAAAAAWGRERGVLVCSDECYIEFLWDAPPDIPPEATPGLLSPSEFAAQFPLGPAPHSPLSSGRSAWLSRPAPEPPLRGRTILAHGSEGVLAVHSLSKQSNFAGMRVGFYSGDAEVVQYLAQARRHLGLMVPGPVQAAAVAALGDDTHTDAQRARYRRRLELLAGLFGRDGLGLDAPLPDGGFYLWIPAPGGDAWGLTERIATEVGALVSPGEFYGAAGRGHIRVAAVAPEDRLALLTQRLAGRVGGRR